MTAPPRAAAPELSVAGAFSLRALSEGRVLALAAVAPPDSPDPVDQALAQALAVQHPDLPLTTSDPADTDPASAERHYSVARANGFPLADGPADVVVLRGELGAVLAHCQKLSHTDRGQVERNAVWYARRGVRPLGVAMATVDQSGTVADFRFQGFVNLGLGKVRVPVTSPSDWSRVDVWSLSLRLQHWLNVATIFALCLTGYFIMHPFYGPADGAGERKSGFLMGYVRMAHFGAAACWVVLGVTRVASAFVSRDRHLRWTEWWPLKHKRDLRALGQVVQHYALIKPEGPIFVAHNPLQQLTYAALYCACGLQMLSGFVLFGLYHQDSPIWRLVSTPVHWFGAPNIRLFHTVMMFALWAFVVMHVYLALRADSLERNGGVSSMINGGVWLRRGTRPVDAPEVG